MVWYPTAEDVVKANMRAVRDDKHPHKLLRSVRAIQSLIVSIRGSESMGLTYQAARFMKEFVYLHAFDGGNHRTAYTVATLFLIENEIVVRSVPATVSYSFVKQISKKSLKEVQEWIQEHMVGR